MTITCELSILISCNGTDIPVTGPSNITMNVVHADIARFDCQCSTRDIKTNECNLTF